MFDAAAERRDLVTAIINQLPPARQATAPTPNLPLTGYRIPTPKVRALARQWVQAHKRMSASDVLAVVTRLWDSGAAIEKHLALELLTLYPRYLPGLSWDHFDHWRRGLGGWDLTDHLGIAIFSPWLLADLDTRTSHLWTLIEDPDLWSRRLALVGVIPINRGHTEVTLPDLTLALVDRVKAEREDLMVKAVSWVLREMTKTHPDRVAAYVEANRGILPALAIREVGNKLRTGLKSGRSKA